LKEDFINFLSARGRNKKHYHISKPSQKGIRIHLLATLPKIGSAEKGNTISEVEKMSVQGSEAKQILKRNSVLAGKYFSAASRGIISLLVYKIGTKRLRAITSSFRRVRRGRRGPREKYIFEYTRTKGRRDVACRDILLRTHKTAIHKSVSRLAENLFMTPNVSHYPAIKITI